METAEMVRTPSTHCVEVLPIVLEPHHNADALSVVHVFGYTVCTRTDGWASVPVDSEGRKLAAYLPPDSVVDVSRPEFAFLSKDAKNGKARIKARNLRGVLSFGLLIPAPDGAEAGDDVADQLGVEHYDPEVEEQKRQQEKGLSLGGGEVASPPPLFAPKYDVEALQRYGGLLFRDGEPVIVTEKIDGANGRFVFVNGQMYCGSRGEWKREFPVYNHITVETLLPRLWEAANRAREKGGEGFDPEARAREIVDRIRSKPPQRNQWWSVLDKTPALRAFCEANPGVVVYGEVYGNNGKMPYGPKPGDLRFAAFDILRDGRWVNGEEARWLLERSGVPCVPLLNELFANPADCWIVPIPYDFARLCELAEGQSLVPDAGHIREGIVVKPVVERRDDRIGRVQLKVRGAAYLEKKA